MGNTHLIHELEGDKETSSTFSSNKHPLGESMRSEEVSRLPAGQQWVLKTGSATRPKLQGKLEEGHWVCQAAGVGTAKLQLPGRSAPSLLESISGVEGQTHRTQERAVEMAAPSRSPKKPEHEDFAKNRTVQDSALELEAAGWRGHIDTQSTQGLSLAGGQGGGPSSRVGSDSWTDIATPVCQAGS